MLVLEKKMSGNEIIDLMRHLYNLKLGISDLKPNKQSIKIRNYLNNFNFYAFSSQH